MQAKLFRRIARSALLCSLLVGSVERLSADDFTPTTNPQTVTNNVSLTAGNNTFTIPTGYFSTFTGVISGPTGGVLVKTGDGILALNGANTYTGGTSLQGGTIRLGNDSALSSWLNATSTRGLVTVTGSGIIETITNPEISNRFVVADDNSSILFRVASGTTLTMQNVTTTASNTTYGGALFTTLFSDSPAFEGGGNLVVRGNTSGNGGGMASYSQNVSTGFDLTELASLDVSNNTAGSGNGGGILVYSSGADHSSTLRFGDNVTLSGNTATSTGTTGDGGAVYIFSGNDNASLEFGNHVTISGNSARRFGGAIYAYANTAGFQADVDLGTNTLFEGNKAMGATALPMGGGAILSSHNVSIQGNTLFRNNYSGAPGGAVVLYGISAGTALLDTTAGDIAFTGNLSGVTNFTTPTGTSNSIHLLRNTNLQIVGSNNVFFDDPISSGNFTGNSLNIGTTANDFTGFTQFRGTSTVLNNFAANVNSGTMRLANATISGTTAGSFKLGSGGTLAGSGTIAIGTNTINGTVAPDSLDYALRTFDSTNSFTGTQTTTGNAIGMLSFTGNTVFDGATLLIDVDDDALTNDKIFVTGAVTFGSSLNTIEINGNKNVPITYDIINSGQEIADPTGLFQVAGLDNARHGSVQLNTDKTVLQVLVDQNAVFNHTLTWTGAIDGNWDEETTSNWTNVPGGAATITKFLNGDRVIFDTTNTVGPFTVNLSGPMIVADMTVTGSGNYVIQGASIGAVDPDDTTLTDPTGLLTKSGTGTLTLNNANSFTGTVIQGGTVVANDLGALGNAVTLDDTAGENATLQFNTNVNGTFGQPISGTGTLVKTGTGTLILAGANNSFTGGTTLVKEGELQGNIADNTALTVASGAVYDGGSNSRNVSSLNGAGTVAMNGTNLTVNGGGDFSTGTLEQIGTLEKNGNDMLTIGTVTAGNLDALTVNGGTLKIDTGKSIVVTNATTINAGTTLNIGALPALTTGSMEISGTGTILDICGCSANGFVVTSATNINGRFATHLVGGVEVTGAVTINQFVNGLTFEYVSTGTGENDGKAGIKVGNGGLVWNNLDTLESHGTFNVVTTFMITQELDDRNGEVGFNPYTDSTGPWNGQTLTKTGAGVLTLKNAANSYGGGTLIKQGTLISQAAGSTGSGKVDVADIAALVLDFNGTFANELTGAGSLTIANSTHTDGATVTIDGNNTGFTGTTTINSGAALTMGTTNAVGNGTAIVNNGTLMLDYAPAVPNQAFGNSLSGNGNLVTTGYYYILGANENFSGTTRVRTGDLQILNSAALGTSSVTVDAGAILELSVFSGTFANALDGAGDLNIRQNSDVTIARDNSGFMGMTTINSDSSLTLQHINAVGNQATQEVRNLGTLVFDLPGTGSETFNPYITQIGNVVKNGAGMLTLAGANVAGSTNFYSGSTTVNAGTLISDLATAAQVDPCGTDLIVAAGAKYQAYSREQWVRNLSGAGTVDMDGNSLTVCSGDFSGGTITGVDTLKKTGPDNTTVLAVGTVSAVDLDHTIGTLSIASGKSIELSGDADFANGTILNIGPNLALDAAGTVTIGSGTTLNVTGYTLSPDPIVLIDAGSDIADEFGTYTVNGVDQTTTISLNNYRNVSPIVQRNKDDMTQIIISVGGLVWNNTAPGTAHGMFNVTGNATVGDNLNDNVTDGPDFGWNGTTLTKTGTGTLTLTGDNGYTGGTVINGGKVVGTHGNAFGTGAVTLGDGSTLEYAITGTTPETVVNNVTGTGNFVKSGTGILIQTGSNTYTGGTTVSGGTLVNNLPDVSVNPPCGTPLLVAAGATYQTYNTNVSVSELTGAGTVNMQAYTDNQNKNLTVCSGDFSDGLITNVATLTKKNDATTFVAGQTNAVNLHLDEGVLNIAEDKSVILSGSATIGDGTTLGIGVGDGTYASLKASGTVTIGDNNTINITGFSGPKMLLIEATGGITGHDVGGTRFTVDGVVLSNTVVLTEFINGIEVTKEDSDTKLYVENGGLVWYNSVDSAPNEAHGTFNVNTNYTVSDVLVDRDTNDFVQLAGSYWDGKTLTKTGAGTLTLSNGDNDYTGGTVIEAGKVVATNAGALGSGTVTNNGQLEFNIATNGTAANVVTGSGTFTKSGVGMLTLTGNNTYTGDTTVNTGTLVSNLAAPTDTLPCGTALFVADGATYSPYNTSQFVSNLTGSGIVDMETKNLTVCEGDFSGGEITGVGTLTKISGNGFPTALVVGDVDGENLDLKSGSLEIAEGKTVALTGDAVIHASTDLIVTASTDAPALTAYHGSVTIGGGTTLRVDGYNPSMGTVVLIDAGSDISNDFNIYMLNGTNQTNTVTLANYRNTSALVQRDADDLSRIIVSTGGLVWNNTAPGTAHGTFKIDSGTVTISDPLIDKPNDGRFYQEPIGTNTWDGKTLTKTGTGNLTLTGDNTYSGGTDIQAGTVVATNQNALGTGAADIETDGKLVLDYDGTLTNKVLGTGQMEIDGNINILVSNDGFHGTVTVASGTTSLQKADGLGDSEITLKDGTTLYFNTASSGSSANTIKGTGGLIKNGNGTLTLENDNQYTGSTVIRGGTLIADLTAADATLPCGAALTVNANTTFQAKSRDQQISVLSGSGTVNMTGKNLTVCSGDFTGGTFENLNNVTKSSTNELRTDGFEAVDFTLQEGTFILNSGQVVTLTGTADIQAGTVLDIGAHLAFDVDGAVTIDPTATLNITGYSGSGEVVLIRSGMDIADHFGTYTINGVKVGEQVPSLDTYYIVNGIERVDNEILITDSHLAWNDPEAAHGTFKIDSGTVTISDPLANVTDSTKWLRDENGVPLWDGVTLTKTGDGTLVLDGENSYHGDTVINGGSVVATGENSLGDPTSSGIVKLTDNNASLVLDYTADSLFDKMVKGGGTIRKTDDKTILVGSHLSEMTGVFRQDAGTVNFRPVDNLFAGSYDQRGGTFIGTDGLTIVGDANFEGTVRPNGTLNVGGSVYFNDGSAFYVELDGDVSKPLLVAKNVVIHDNTTLQVKVLSPLTVQEYEIIETTDGITGLFTDLERFDTYKYQLTQELHDNDTSLWLTWTPTGNRFTDPFENIDDPNAENAAGGADDIDDGGGLGQLGDLGDALNNLGTDDDIIGAFKQLHGELYASGREGAAQMQRRFVGQLPSARNRKAKTACNPCDAACSGKSWNRWANFTGDWADRDNIGPYSGYDLRSSGVAFGFDRDINRRLFVGVAFAYDDATQKFDTIRSRTEFDVFRSMLYAGYRKGSWYADAHLGYTKDWYKTRRDINIGDFAGTARSKFNDDMLSAGLEIGRKLRVGRTSFTPSLGFKYIYLDSPGVTERGADGANLHVYGGDFNSLRLSLGARFSRDFSSSTSRGAYTSRGLRPRITWTPELRAFYVAELCDDSSTAWTSYNNVRDVTFSASSGSWGRSSGLFGAGLKAQLTDRMNFRVDYDHEFYEKTDRGEFSVSVGINW